MKAPDFQKAVHARGFGVILSGSVSTSKELQGIYELPAYSNKIDERLWLGEFSETRYRVRARAAMKLWECCR